MTDALKFSIKLVMESDWHVGSGEGRFGSTDRLIDRDGDRLPYVPATTIRGMWRDAAERLAYGLDNGVVDGPWTKLVAMLFGSQPALVGRGLPVSPREREAGAAAAGVADSGERVPAPVSSAISIADALFNKNLREALRGTDPGVRRLRDALTFVKPGVGVRGDSGQAEPDFLRFEEMAGAGAELFAEGTLKNAKGDGGKLVTAFLVASAALIDRLGGKRRRGSGRCSFQVGFNGDARFDGKRDWPARVEEACDLLGGDAPAYVPEAEEVSSDVTYRDKKDDDHWTIVPYRLKLKTPVCAPAEIQGNIVTTLDFIPGFYLLPWVTKALSQGNDAAAVRGAIAAGDIRISPAYPLPKRAEAGAQAFPMPFCLFAKKGEEHEPYKNGATVASECLRGLKGEREGFVTLKDRGAELSIRLKEPETVTRTHNTVDDVVQRPTEDVGGVYSYEAIAAGTVLTGVVSVRSSALQISESDLKGRLEAPLADGLMTLGRASKAGYGKVGLEVGGRRLPEAPPASAGPLVIWCISDVLLPSVSEEGETTYEAVATAIEGLLGKGAGAAFERPSLAAPDANSERTGGRADEPRAFARLRRHESWNKGWGKPRPSLIAITAGSVFVLPLAAGASLERKVREKIAREGLGIRKAEGFGMIMVDPPLLKESRLKRAINDTDKDEAMPRGTVRTPTAFTNLIEDAAWKNAIADAAETFAASAENRRKFLGWSADGPSPSQLGALREAMGELKSKHDVDMLRAFVSGSNLASEEARKAAQKRRKQKFGDTAYKQLGALVLGDKPALGKLPDTVWTLLGLHQEKADVPAPLPSTAEAMRNREDMKRHAIAATLWSAMHHERRTRENPRPASPGSASASQAVAGEA